MSDSSSVYSSSELPSSESSSLGYSSSESSLSGGSASFSSEPSSGSSIVSHDAAGRPGSDDVLAAKHGMSRNRHGNFFKSGSPHCLATKLIVANEYQKACIYSPTPPTISSIAKKTGYSWNFTKKIVNEIKSFGRVVDPKDLGQNKRIPRGPGSKSLDEFDRFVLLMLYLDEPSRTLSSYRSWLWYYTDTIVSENTISQFFLRAFPIRGGLCKPNLVPFDKFRPANCEKALEYCEFLMKVSPHRVKFGDEKLLKGQEIYCRRTRHNVITGKVPAVVTSSDLRNTYAITGFCGIDRRVSPLCFRIHELRNDATQFALDVERAIRIRWLLPGDIFAIDNCTIHNGGENAVLGDWLWERFAIFLLFLPARTPEWNPMELVWRDLSVGMRARPIAIFRETDGSSAIPSEAKDILDAIPHYKIDSFYKICKVI